MSQAETLMAAQKMQEYIDEHLYEKITLGDTLKRFRLQQSNNHLFKGAVGFEQQPL